MGNYIYIGCSDVRHAGYPASEGCCNSCHDDEEEGYTNGMCVMRSDYPDFIEPSVCCEVSRTVGEVDWFQLILAHCDRYREMLNG